MYICSVLGEAWEASVEHVIGREPNENEREALAMFGLLEKMLWLDSDIQRARTIVELCVGDMTFVNKFLIETAVTFSMLDMVI